MMIASKWEISSFLVAAVAFVDKCVDKENLHYYLN
jgi:hypothetical protein